MKFFKYLLFILFTQIAYAQLSDKLQIGIDYNYSHFDLDLLSFKETYTFDEDHVPYVWSSEELSDFNEQWSYGLNTHTPSIFVKSKLYVNENNTLNIGLKLFGGLAFDKIDIQDGQTSIYTSKNEVINYHIGSGFEMSYQINDVFYLHWENYLKYEWGNIDDVTNYDSEHIDPDPQYYEQSITNKIQYSLFSSFIGFSFLRDKFLFSAGPEFLFLNMKEERLEIIHELENDYYIQDEETLESKLSSNIQGKLCVNYNLNSNFGIQGKISAGKNLLLTTSFYYKIH